MSLEIDKKAEKDQLIANQEKFFSNLTKMESQTDSSISKLVGDELKKLGEQISTNNKVVDKKLEKVYKDLDIKKLTMALEKKFGREEAKHLFDSEEAKISLLEKQLKKSQETVTRLESFAENLALAIRTLEKNNASGTNRGGSGQGN